MKHRVIHLLLVVLMLSAFSLYTPTQTSQAQTIGDCPTLPPDNIWNTPINDLPLDPNSDLYLNQIGRTVRLHPDFGSGVWPPGSNAPIGIPYIEVPGTQPKVEITFIPNWGKAESDPGPYPIPPNAPIEGGPDSTGDRHVIVIDQDNCILYELYNSHPQPNGSWHGDSGAIFDLNSNALRPDGWTSADAAGLPIFPGLVRYDEILAGEINHAIRFTLPQTRRAYVWPARHYASNLTAPQYVPMGQRFRLRADFNISGFDPQVQVILQAFKTYGIILADNGSAMYISGAPDERWNNTILRQLRDVTAGDFEAVDVSSLMHDPNSGRINRGHSNGGDTLASFNPTNHQVSLVHSLANNPPAQAYQTYTANPPINPGANTFWVMGDWDGNGTQTPGVYQNGAFHLTNALGANTTWTSHWLGITQPAAVLGGHFNMYVPNDCIGAVEQAALSGFTVFVLYYTCDFSSATPNITWHWISAPLPNQDGFSGNFQFVSGDWNGDNAATIAVRRGEFIAFSNVKIVDLAFNGSPPFSPNNTGAEFVFAQYWGAPDASPNNHFVAGNWNANSLDSFGVVYPTRLIYRNNLAFNQPDNYLQNLNNPIGEPRQVVTWRPHNGGGLTADLAPLSPLADVSELLPLEGFSAEIELTPLD